MILPNLNFTPTEGNDTKLILRSPPNFEEPDDTGFEDNQYEVTVIVTDSDQIHRIALILSLIIIDEDEYAIFDYDGNSSGLLKLPANLMKPVFTQMFFKLRQEILI